MLLRLKKCGQNIQLLGEIIAAAEELVDVEVGQTVEKIVAEDLSVAAEEIALQTFKSNVINEELGTMETNIDEAMGTLAKTAPEGSVAEEALSVVDDTIKTVVANPATTSVSIVDKIITSTKTLYNTVTDWYENSVVGKVFKAIGKAYDSTVEAAYKKYIYDNLIAPLENNSLNKGLESIPHYLRMPFDMLTQTIIMNGGGMITNWVDTENTNAFNKLQTQANSYDEGYKVFTSNLQASQLANVAIASSNFGALLSNFSNYQRAIYSTSLAQLSMISKSLLKQQNPTFYLNDPTDQNNYTFWIDQYFVLSPMYNASIPTLNNPLQSYPVPIASSNLLNTSSVLLPAVLPFSGAWHNVWRTGNWEFIDKAFYQLNVVP
ncbi:hypothetical protein EBU24_06650, partial [bacterium]|nr:hypothetical protein [bacterium]